MTASGNPVDLVARWMAVGSLAISALSFLYLIRKDRRKISVKASNVRRFHAGEDFEDVLGVTVVNTGHRPITIAGYTIEFSDGSILHTGATSIADPDGQYGRIDRIADSDDLDKRIEDGESAKVFFEYDRIGQFMASIGADVELKAIYAYDAEREKHEAKVPKYIKKDIASLRDSQV